MKYVVVGYAIVNSVHYCGGNKTENNLGGCGIYSLSGIRLFDDDCLLVAGAGNDFNEYFGKWFDDNGLSRDGILIRDEHTINSVLTYNEDGSYTDRSRFGGDLVHSSALVLTADDYAAYLKGAKGLYLYGSDVKDTEKLLKLKREYGFKLMCELRPYVEAKDLADVKHFLSCCDYFSLNLKESLALFSVKNEEQAIDAIQETGVPCYFRVGKKGAYMITPTSVDFAASVHIADDEPDPTGCGNSSTAAAFWALCEGYDPLMAACVGSTAAAYNVAQRGPIPVMDKALRFEAINVARRVYNDRAQDLGNT